MGKSRPKLQRSFSTIKRQFSWRKSIRPFISSTFLDFQEERGHLLRYVFPQLNSVCHARGTYFAPVDLRWGINEEQAQSGNVVSLCLEYVNHCSPFFICLIGERYGTHRAADAKLLPSSLDKLPKNVSWLDRNYLVAASKGYDWILQEAYQYCSVTELEIIQAAFLNDNQFCRFYIRDVRHIEDKFLDLPEKVRQEKLKIYQAENEETEMRVTALKHRIISKGLRVKFFRTPEELGQLVLEEWMEVINDLYPPLDDILGDVDGEQFREWAAHEAYAETRRRVFVRTPEIDKLFQKVTDHCEAWIDPDTPTTSEKSEWVVVKGKKKTQVAPAYKSIVTLVGERGCGKTSLVANWVREFQSSHPNVKVLAHYVGSSALSTDIRSFLRRVTFELRGQYGGDGPAETGGDSEELSNFHRICEAFVAAIAMGPCILVLDAVDELGNTMGMGVHQVKELKWLPAVLPAHCKIVITTIRSDLTYKSLSFRQDSEALTVPLFTGTEDKAAVIKHHLAMHCKCLDAGHLNTIVKCKMSSRPLFLTILASELRVCGTFDNLSALLDRYVSAPSFRDLWKCIISRWTQEYGWSTEGMLSASMSASMRTDAFTGWVAETLRLLVCSRHGLSEADILALLEEMGYRGHSKVTSFDFALFRSAASEALVERPGGLFGFFHQDMRDAVLNSLLGVIPGLNVDQTSSTTTGSFLPQILNGQMQQCHEHLAEYFLHQPASRRRVEELPYHLDRCGDIHGLNKVITNPDTFLTMQADTSQNIALKLDLLHYCNRLTKENFNVTESLTKMVANAVGGEDNPAKVKSGSRVSFADDVGEMVMRSNTRMDWDLPGFKRTIKTASVGARSDNFTSASSRPMVDLTAGRPGKADNINLDTKDQRSNFSNSFDDFDSFGSRQTINKSTMESEDGERLPREDLTMSRATRTDADNIEGDDGEAGLSSRTESTQPPPPPPPLPPLSPGAISGRDSSRSNMTFSEMAESRPQSQVESHISRQDVEEVSSRMQSLSLSKSSSVGSGIKAAEQESELGEMAAGQASGISDADVLKASEKIKRSLVSFADDEQDMLDDLVTSLGDAFESKSGRASKSSKGSAELQGLREREEPGEENEEEEEASEDDEEDFDEQKIRCKGALLAMHVGKFLAEKSNFEQANEMLMLAYDRIIESFPLTHKEQLLLVEVQESIGERHLFELRKEEAQRFFKKALSTLAHIIEEESYDDIKPLLEIKGRLLNRLGHMAVHDFQVGEAEEALVEASECMKKAGSVAGIATAQFHLGFLKMKMKEYGAAQASLQEALQVRERWYGSAHPSVAEVLNELAGLLCRQDNEESYDRLRAESYYRRALKIREDAFGDDHLLVATTLYHMGKLLREDGSFQSKKEALDVMSRALDIRTTKFGAHHKLTYCIQNAVKNLRKDLNRGDYDRAPVKPPDKRSRQNPRSSLSFREQDLLRVGQRSPSHSPSRSPSRGGSGHGGRKSPRAWHSEDRSRSPRRGSGKQDGPRSSLQYGRSGHLGQSAVVRDRAQSFPSIKFSGAQESGPGNHARQNKVPANSSSASSTSSSSSSSSGKGPTLRAKYLHDGRSEGKDDSVSFAEGHTVLGSSEMNDDATSQGEKVEEKNHSKEAPSSRRSYSAVSGSKTAASEASVASHSCHDSSPFEGNVNGPKSKVTDLLRDEPAPRPKSMDSINSAAWYHGKGRYPKDQRDIYPPRRHQQRPNRHQLPDTDTNRK